MNAEVLTIKGEKFAIIPLAVYEKLIEMIEDAQDVADAAIAFLLIRSFLREKRLSFKKIFALRS